MILKALTEAKETWTADIIISIRCFIEDIFFIHYFPQDSSIFLVALEDWIMELTLFRALFTFAELKEIRIILQEILLEIPFKAKIPDAYFSFLGNAGFNSFWIKLDIKSFEKWDFLFVFIDWLTFVGDYSLFLWEWMGFLVLNLDLFASYYYIGKTIKHWRSSWVTIGGEGGLINLFPI